MPARPPSRRALVALVLVGAGAIGVAACSGDEGPASGSTTTVTTADRTLQYTAYSNPSDPITVPVGHRFAIMLPADPAHGWRWVVEPVDTRYLLPLGSEFRDDPALLAQATTTTTVPPPRESTTTAPGSSARSTSTVEAPTSTTTEAPTTTTTAPGPLVQIVSFAGRAPGQASVTLRYERIGSADQEPAAAQRLVFGVQVGDPPPPSSQPAGPFG